MTDAAQRLAASLADRYHIERELGAGGMATVYLAHDVRHDRKVALKVMRPELAAILGAERFLKEIKTTANLQHPHILPLHDSGEAEGIVYYVMPYVEGESLRDRLAREHQLPLEEAVRIAREVLSALDYAHRHQVVHRDIKPENILLHEGQALVSDFGIALAVSTAGAGTRITETGMSLGTPHYMAPEQAMGEKEITPKADVYALGCVLYEMLVGEPPFTGPTAQAIIARVVTEEPRSLTLQRRTIPTHLEAAVRKALEKLPADRFAGAAQFAEALARPEPAVTPGAAVTADVGARVAALQSMRSVLAGGLRRAAPWAVAAALGALALWGWLRPQRLPPPPPMERFSVTFPRGFEASEAGGSPIAVSPDGSRIVYVGVDSQRVRWLFSRGFERVDPVVIAGTRGAQYPLFSPDGQWIAFFQEGRLRKVSLSGGAVVTICELPGFSGGSWGAGDVIVFSSLGSLFRVPAAGGRPDTVLAPDSSRQGEFYRWPDLLPDGQTVLFTHVQPSGSALAAVSLEDRRIRPLAQAGMSPRYVERGYLVFAQSDGTLFAAPFDARRARFTGPPQPIAENVRIGPAQVAKLGIARTGSLAYLSGSSLSRELVIVDRQGRVQLLPAPPGRYRQPRFSPDGRRIAMGIDHASFLSGDIWVYDLAARNLARLTFDSVSILPEWMPDGRRVAYVKWLGASSDRMGLFRIAADGSGVPETLLVRQNSTWEAQFTADGRRMAFRETHPQTSRDIWVAPTDSPQAATPLLRTPFNERSIALSPDGRWLAYVSNETGTDEVYVRRPQEGSPRWRVSTGGALGPRFSRSGRELFFWGGDSLYAVTLEGGDEPRLGPARALLGGRYESSSTQVPYDVAPDGNRFVLVRSQLGQGTEELHVILHWFDQLRRARKP